MQEPQEVHNVFMAPLLDMAIERLGTDAVQDLLARHGKTEAELRTRDGWFGLAFLEALVDDLTEATDDPQFVGRACQQVFAGDYLGPLKPMLRMFGSPHGAFDQMASSLPRFNKTSRAEILERGPSSVVVAFYSDRETNPLICQGRVGQFAAVPQLFDWPHGHVEHPECVHRGDARCLYEVSWEPQSTSWGRRMFAFPAAAAGVGVGVLLGLGVGGVALLALLGAALAVAVIHSRELRERLDQRTEELLDHDNALERTIIVNERRFAELQAAKESIERQVEERTAELREASEQLADALAEVRSLDESKTRFFANVSHELRTPLQLILGPLDDLVAEREPVGGRDRAFRAMRRSARRLHGLIDQLLDLARVDAGAEHATRLPVAPDALATEVVEGFRPAADKKGIHLYMETSAAPAAMLDAHWLESALTNLVANALRHCDTGDRVVVRVTHEAGTLGFDVEDTGPGIPAADLPSIFDRFAQSEQKEGASRGTGLGLAIVHEAARLHDGTASVESEVGLGTTFRLRMPLVAASSEPVPAASIAPTEVVAELPPELPPVITLPGPHPQAPRAVIAEDNPDLRSFVAHTLATRYRVTACADGQLALEVCAREVPELVVTDRSMPRMTGLELTQRLRELPTTREVPILMLTAHAEITDVLAAFDVGADDYVTKPFHARELLARVEAHVGYRRLAREAMVNERRASVGMLAAEVAHHVRNPLNLLTNGLPVLERALGEEQERPRRLLERMQESAARIEVLTADLLHLADGPARGVREAHAVVPGMQAAARMATAGHGPGTIELGDVRDGTVYGVAGDLVQAWLGLFDHALRTSAAAGAVRVDATPLEDRMVVTIEDAGDGVPEGLAEVLRQAHLGAERRVPGTGLGLAIAARMVTDHGGTITVGPAERLSGARLTVTLPLHREAASVA